jgi:hypothetical protein
MEKVVPIGLEITPLVEQLVREHQTDLGYVEDSTKEYETECHPKDDGPDCEFCGKH